jgi:hypothetical protein
LAKDVWTLISIVAFAALFVILVVPGVASDRVQRDAALLFALSSMALVLFAWHVRTINKLSSRVARLAALGGPLATILLLWIAPRQRADWIDVVYAIGGAYLLGIAIVAAIVWFTRRP